MNKAVFDPISKVWSVATETKVLKECWRIPTRICNESCAAFEIKAPEESDTAVDIILHCLPPGIMRMSNLDIVRDRFASPSNVAAKEQQKDL